MSDPRRDSPLRASKKRRTRSDLLANAIAFFRRKGIRATRASEIAAAAEVSPATLFNYFATKGELAEAWVRGELAEQLAALEEAGRGGNLRSNLRGFCEEWAALNEAEAAVRLEAWRETPRAAAAPSDRARAVVRWIDRDQKSGKLRADLSSEVLAEALVEALESGLIAGLRAPDFEAPGASVEQRCEVLAAEMRSRVDLVLDGARKRNERVVASSGAARSSVDE